MKQSLNYLTLFSLISGFLFWSCGNDRENPSMQTDGDEQTTVPRLMMEPADSVFFIPVGHLTDGYQPPEHLDQNAALSFIFVEPVDSWSSIRNYSAGSILHFSLDEDLTISARINRNQAIGERIRNLTTTILAPYDGVVTLSVNEETMTGNIDLVSENRLFHVRYDSLSGLHYLAEIDRSKLDVQQGSEPLEFE